MKPSVFLFAAACAGCAKTAAPVPPAQPTSLSSAEAPARASSESAPAEASPPPTTQAQPSAQSGHASRNLRNAGWASIAIGGTSTVAAIASSIVMIQDMYVRSQDCNVQKVCTADGANANSSLANNGTVNVVLWALGISGLAVGTYFVLTNPARNVTVGIAPRESGADFALRGTF